MWVATSGGQPGSSFNLAAVWSGRPFSRSMTAEAIAYFAPTLTSGREKTCSIQEIAAESRCPMPTRSDSTILLILLPMRSRSSEQSNWVISSRVVSAGCLPGNSVPHTRLTVAIPVEIRYFSSSVSSRSGYTNAARAMMFSVGCIQSRRCHTNHCPTGVATQDERRAAALDVAGKTERVFRYQRSTVRSAQRIMASMGVRSHDELRPHMLRRRLDAATVRSYAEMYAWLEPGELLGAPPPGWADDWKTADPDAFTI